MAPRIEEYALLSDMASAALVLVLVLETIFTSDGGEVAVIDCMPGVMKSWWNSTCRFSKDRSSASPPSMSNTTSHGSTTFSNLLLA